MPLFRSCLLCSDSSNLTPSSTSSYLLPVIHRLSTMHVMSASIFVVEHEASRYVNSIIYSLDLCDLVHEFVSFCL